LTDLDSCAHFTECAWLQSTVASNVALREDRVGRVLMEEQDAAEVFDVVHARILRFFPALVAELAGDQSMLLRQVGIDPENFSEVRPGATYRQMVNLLELAAEELACPDFGMRLATLQSGRMYGPLGAVMRNSKTFGEALDYVSKHTYAHSLAARIWMERCPDENAVFVGHEILLDRIPNKNQVMEQIMLVGHLGAMEITGGHARVRRVHFRHQPVSPLKVYRRYFGCEVRFGENEYGVVFSDRDLACPIVDPDERAYQKVTAFIDAEFTQHKPPLHAQVRGVVMQLLGTEYCTNDHVAAELNVHPRTLHRRLRAEGTSFQKIKDEVRRDVMLYYLRQTDLDFAWISERLGFAEQSVMTRRCNRWFSVSPTKLRSGGSQPTVAN
jgi:AraC-like DNA-binding protein